MKVKPLFAWYDMWIGAYWDRKNRKLYVLPVPCLGVVVELGTPCRCRSFHERTGTHVADCPCHVE